VLPLKEEPRSLAEAAGGFSVGRKAWVSGLVLEGFAASGLSEAICA